MNLDGLRLKAEQETRDRLSKPSNGPGLVQPKQRQKRPTWAPALIIEGELLEGIRSFDWLKPEDKPVARLWALFLDPRRGEPVVCEGFELLPGQERKGGRMFRAMHADRVKQIAEYKEELLEIEGQKECWNRRWSWTSTVEFYRRKIEELEGRDSDWHISVDCWYHNREEQARYERLQELAYRRVMEFCGDPDEQRREGGQLTGHCGICGKHMTDPISIEYGIGPECRSGYTVSRQSGLFTTNSVFGNTEWVERLKKLKAMPTPEFIKALGLKMPCTIDDLRSAYRGLALQVHPDVGGDHEDFIELKDNFDAAVEFLEECNARR
jgi:hypothetical protein